MSKRFSTNLCGILNFVLASLFENSAGTLIVGMIIGGMVRLTTDKLQLFEFVSL